MKRNEWPLSSPLPPPGPDNDYHARLVTLLCQSLIHWGGPNLVPPDIPEPDAARFLYHAPFVLVSHDTRPDPVFQYGNETALRLFEMSWEEFTNLPSRLSAETLHQDDRNRLLAEVSAHGMIRNYAGIRISRGGHRFRIRNGMVWNLLGADGRACGQAACFKHWDSVSSSYSNNDKSNAT